MKVKLLKAREIKDTRGDKTIEVELVTNKGEFIASAPNGKSKGRFEKPVWKKSLKEDIKVINNYFIEDISFKEFDDLQLIENIFNDIVGGNSVIAIEYCFLKALALEQDKEVWEIINSRALKMPMPVGNIIGGGAHSRGKSPDFQEFHIIPITSFYEAVKILKRAHENCKRILKNVDSNFKEELSDESAWQTSLSNKQAMEVLKDVRDNMIDEFKTKVHIGIDVAASSFFSNGKYSYKNEKKTLNKKGQIDFMVEIAKDFYYLEDSLEEQDFDGFAKLMKNSKGLIVGDDLTTTNLDRLQTAYLKKSVNAIIVKPNQVGSLIEVKKIVQFCKKNKIKVIFSHRSGETSENILADLAFGFQADFIKTGAVGKGREEKLNRLVEIEKGL